MKEACRGSVTTVGGVVGVSMDKLSMIFSRIYCSLAVSMQEIDE